MPQTTTWLNRTGDMNKICKLMAKGRHKKISDYMNERLLRYPLIDHESVWKVKGRARDVSMYMLVSHSYWNPRSMEQLEELQARHKNVTVIVRDAVWGGEHKIKQVFVMGSQMPVDQVLGLPYDFFDDRCSAPSISLE
jgi:hypothetical protein